jgi:hypothetical protein
MSENPNTLDLPSSYKYPSTLPDLIDADFSTYQLQQQGNSQVYVEKFIVEKKYYQPFLGASLGSTKRSRRNCILIKEDSFTDIGGGYASFLRHYARIPDSWFDYEIKSIQFWFGFTTSDNRVGINYDYGAGRIPYGFENYGFTSGYYSRNVTLNTKATRYYLTESLLDSYFNNQYILPESGASWKYNPVYPEASTENDYTTSFFNSESRTLPSRLIVNEPRVKTLKSDETEMVVATDSIKKWYGKIYELTRYTSQLQPDFATEVSVLTVQVSYSFGSDVTQAQRDSAQISIGSNTDVEAETLVTVAQQTNPIETFETQFSLTISSGLYATGITTRGGTSSYDTGNSLVTTKWNGLDETIIVNILLTKNVLI